MTLSSRGTEAGVLPLSSCFSDHYFSLLLIIHSQQFRHSEMPKHNCTNALRGLLDTRGTQPVVICYIHNLFCAAFRGLVRR